MRVIFCVAALSLLSLFVEGQIMRLADDTPEIIKDPAAVVEDWEHLENLLKTLAKDGAKSLMSFLMGNTQNLNISTTCIREITHVIGGIRKLKSWALRFVDSTAKGMDGIISGTAFSYGSYDECLDTVVLNKRFGKNKGEVLFTGKYCLLRIKGSLPPSRPNLRFGEVMDELKSIYERDTVLSEIVKYAPLMYSIAFRMGLCVPSGCSTDEINQMLAEASNYTRLYLKVNKCEVKEEPKYTPLMIFVMSFYSFIGLLLVLATVTDYYFRETGKKPTSLPVRLLLVFSFPSNFRKLVNTSGPAQPLKCFHGIRFFTMSWIIFVHSYALVGSQAVSEIFYAKEKTLKNFAFQAITNAIVAVDTFFFLGGFLVCYLATKHVIFNGKSFSVKVFILHRIWRILPVMAFVILYVFIAELTASGPMASEVFQTFTSGCKNYWWTNFLFINNIYRPTDGCLHHTWYLAVDMQLYIASLVILLPLLRWPKVGLSVAVVSLTAVMIGSAVQIYVKNFPPTFLLLNFDSNYMIDYLTQHYMMPHAHAGPYIVGILSGYFLAMKPDLKIPKVVQIVGWSCTIICGASVLYGPYVWLIGKDPTFLETIFFGGCHKVAWASSIAWVIICCATGHGGIVNYILSMKALIPLARLTYMAYLVHVVLMITFMAAIRSTFPPLHVIWVWLSFGHLMASYGVAFVGAMMIEAPVLSLEKIFLPQRSGKPPSENRNDFNHALSTVEVAKERYTKNLENIFTLSKSNRGIENDGFVHKL